MPNVIPLRAAEDEKTSRQNLWTDPANTLQALVNDMRVGRRKANQILVIYPDERIGKMCLIQCGYKKRDIATALKGIIKSLESETKDGRKRSSQQG